MSLSGILKPFLDDLAQTSVVIATAQSANVSTSFVFFIKQELTNGVPNKFLKSVSYDIDATTQLNVPTNGKSPQTLYDSVVSNLVNSVSNGDFNAFLMSASIALNSSSTQNAFSNGVVLTPMTVLGGVPSFGPSFAPSGAPIDEDKTMFIVIVVLLILVFGISIYKKYKSNQEPIINIEIESI